MTTESLKIEKIIHSGRGLARLKNGQVILVQQGLPGEEIEPEIIEQKKQYQLARPRSFITVHKERISPPCPHYLECGGCDFQHASYRLQLQMKKDIITDLFQRTFHELPPPSAEVIKDTLPSPRTSHYRQRIRLQVDTNGHIGFHRSRSHCIVAISSCLLAEDLLNSTLKRIMTSSSANILLTNCRELELFLNPVSGTVIACMHYKRKLRPADRKAAQMLTEDTPLLDAVFFQGQSFPLTGPFSSPGQQVDKTLICRYPASTLFDEPITFKWEVGGFIQVNLDQNRRLIECVLGYCKAGRNDRILDLFCGMGNFSIPLSFMCHSLLGVETQRSAIRSARLNSDAANRKNCTFVQADVNQYCNHLLSDNQRFDTIVLDPPRMGIPQMTQTIAQLAVNKIIYISCDPATLFRDLASFTQSGFTIEQIQPVDMFPQTHHIETIASLKRNE